MVKVRREEGGGIANYVKSRTVTTGISLGLIAKRVLRVLRANSVRENFEQSKRDLEGGYPITLVQEILTEVKFTDRNEALRNKTKQKRFYRLLQTKTY